MNIGIDIGGTSIKAGVVKSGEVMKLERVKTPKEKEEFVFAVKNVIQYLLEEYPDVKGIGIGCPGPLDSEKGILLNTPNLPHNTDLGVLRKEFKMPVKFNNDANSFTLAEAVYGAGKDVKHVLGVTLGTGFGCGLVVHKNIYSGRGNAVEFAHTIINKNEEEKLPHLVRGCAEQYVSVVGLLRLASKYDLDVKNPFEIYQIATMKNEKALSVFKEFGRDLGIVLSNCIHAYDPEVIIIGGEISQAWTYFEEAMLAAIEENCLHECPVIVRSHVKDAGVVGASLLVSREEMMKQYS